MQVMEIMKYVYVADWRWRTMFVEKAMQEVAGKLKNWKTLQSGKTTEKQRRLEEFPTQHDQESRTVSLLFYDLDLLSSYDGHTFLITLLLLRVQESLAAKLECREIHERMWVFLKTFFDRQHARRDPDDWNNYSRNLATPSGIADDVKDFKKRRNWG